MSSYSSLYAGCGTAAAAAGPLLVLDIIAGVTAVGLTGYCVYEGVKAYNDATVLPNEGVLSKIKDKSISFAKVNDETLTKSKTAVLPRSQGYTVYKLVDNTQKVQYIGRTGDVSATIRRHQNNMYRTNLNFQTIHTGLSYETSRGLEQYYIEYYSTLNKNNKANNQINGVNTKNKKKYNYYSDIARRFLAGETYVGG